MKNYLTAASAAMASLNPIDTPEPSDWKRRELVNALDLRRDPWRRSMCLNCCEKLWSIRSCSSRAVSASSKRRVGAGHLAIR